MFVDFWLRGGYFEDDEIDFYILVNKGEVVNVPDPVKEGYEFGGWYLDDYYAVKANLDEPVLDHMDLYALWIEEVEFEFAGYISDYYNWEDDTTYIFDEVILVFDGDYVDLGEYYIISATINGIEVDYDYGLFFDVLNETGTYEIVIIHEDGVAFVGTIEYEKPEIKTPELVELLFYDEEESKYFDLYRFEIESTEELYPIAFTDPSGVYYDYADLFEIGEDYFVIGLEVFAYQEPGLYRFYYMNDEELVIYELVRGEHELVFMGWNSINNYVVSYGGFESDPEELKIQFIYDWEYVTYDYIPYFDGSMFFNSAK